MSLGKSNALKLNLCNYFPLSLANYSTSAFFDESSVWFPHLKHYHMPSLAQILNENCMKQARVWVESTLVLKHSPTSCNTSFHLKFDALLGTICKWESRISLGVINRRVLVTWYPWKLDNCVRRQKLCNTELKRVPYVFKEFYRLSHYDFNSLFEFLKINLFLIKNM